MATAAGDRTMRRRAGRRQTSTTPADIGTALREAREGTAATLTEIHDRTGIHWQQLEALESGDLSRFPDERAAVTAVRRYADLMSLDSEGFSEVVRGSWGSWAAASPDTGARSGRRRRRSAPQRAVDTATAGAAGPAGGHLSRYPGDGSHLRAFTQTAEVPGVQRAGFSAGRAADTHGDFSVTGVFPATTTWRPPSRGAPLVLLGAIWCTLAVLVVALIGLAVHHWEPKWLTAIHVEHTVTTTSAPSAPGSGGSRTTTPARRNAVTESSVGNGSAAISVDAAEYSVVVAVNGGPGTSCWVLANTPQSFAPVYEQTLSSGQSTTISSADGQLTLHLGSSNVLVAVKIGGKTAQGSLFKPPTAPFILNFTSASPAK